MIVVINDRRFRPSLGSKERSGYRAFQLLAGIVDRAHFFLRDSEVPDKSFDKIAVEISSRKYPRGDCVAAARLRKS